MNLGQDNHLVCSPIRGQQDRGSTDREREIGHRSKREGFYRTVESYVLFSAQVKSERELLVAHNEGSTQGKVHYSSSLSPLGMSMLLLLPRAINTRLSSRPGLQPSFPSCSYPENKQSRIRDDMNWRTPNRAQQLQSVVRDSSLQFFIRSMWGCLRPYTSLHCQLRGATDCSFPQIPEPDQLVNLEQRNEREVTTREHSKHESEIGNEKVFHGSHVELAPLGQFCLRPLSTLGRTSTMNYLQS